PNAIVYIHVKLASISFSLMFLKRATGTLNCEDLSKEECAFSVSSSGARCVLEKYIGNDHETHIECQSSMILAANLDEWIESDECVRSCGLERLSFGLSTDLLLDSRSTAMLCSPECLNNCPNIIDLYINLAAGEGLYLPQLCKSPRMISCHSIVDPIKMAKESAQYKSSLHISSLETGGAQMALNGFRGESGNGFSESTVIASGPAPSPTGAPTSDQKGNSRQTDMAGLPSVAATAAPAPTPSVHQSGQTSSLGSPVRSSSIQPGSIISVPNASPVISAPTASPATTEAAIPNTEYDLPIFAAADLEAEDLMYESYFI
ncbi:unnamed protein product, partial [Sphagnum compactum]